MFDLKHKFRKLCFYLYASQRIKKKFPCVSFCVLYVCLTGTIVVLSNDKHFGALFMEASVNGNSFFYFPCTLGSDFI